MEGEGAFLWPEGKLHRKGVEAGREWPATPHPAAGLSFERRDAMGATARPRAFPEPSQRGEVPAVDFAPVAECVGDREHLTAATTCPLRHAMPSGRCLEAVHVGVLGYIFEACRAPDLAGRQQEKAVSAAQRCLPRRRALRGGRYLRTSTVLRTCSASSHRPRIKRSHFAFTFSAGNVSSMVAQALWCSKEKCSPAVSSRICQYFSDALIEPWAEMPTYAKHGNSIVFVACSMWIPVELVVEQFQQRSPVTHGGSQRQVHERAGKATEGAHPV